MADGKILLTPGPCMTSEGVRRAVALSDLNHREPAYLDLIRETKSRLLEVHEGMSEWVPYLLGGSGTSAIEAMVTSCVERGPVLIVANGYYSERIDAIFHVHDIPCETLAFPWLAAWDLPQIEGALRRTQFEAVFAVHHETTTGRLNPVAELGELAHRYGARCLIDTMSSFGADPLDVTHLDAVGASGNKCLHGIPGVGFVVVRPELAEAMRTFPRRTYSLWLPMMEGDKPPLTPPVPAMRALRQALREMAPGYSAGRREVYEARNRILRSAGFTAPISAEEGSCTLVMAEVPEGWTYDEWFAVNYEAGFVIYGAKNELSAKYFQVSTMGELPDGAVDQWAEWAQSARTSRRMKG